MTSSKLSDHVRAETNASPSLTDITRDVSTEIPALSSVSPISSSSQHPPNSIRSRGLAQISKELANSMITTKPPGANSNISGNSIPKSHLYTTPGPPTTVVSNVMFYFHHVLLLSLFFVISIYKNINYLYRRLLLKFYTLTYYPNKSPQIIRDDVNRLSKIPKVISCILDLKDDDDENGGIDGLINQISELSAWTVSAGIPQLVIYEYNGVLINNKGNLAQLKRYISKNLTLYYGTDLVPNYSIRIPHKNLIIYSDPAVTAKEELSLEILLLSRVDGKPTIVELTKTMSELAINKELSIKDISIELIDEELLELVGPEPDLLISFGPSLDLQDYPPWHIRLSEIYWEPDNKDVSYAVFIRALQQFSNCKVNVGK
ncbi:Decaprenyl diphosphate synthase-like protein [Scheffersomyces xylosifermentans]|uniref:Decaprenyl diphosphate synthase-like protein n=1 Tax=Scheffersomyces xylosifermentans TaxID=1304137 RepID=UPI00315DA990